MSHAKNWYAISNKAADAADVEIYDEIGSFGISAKNFSDSIKGLEGKHINLRINSPGGSVHDGQAIITALSRHKGGYTAHIDGLAASMASVIACSAKETKMAEGSLMMIHCTSTYSGGNAADLRKDAALLDKTDAICAAVYASKTGKSIEDIKAIMEEETWMDATDCLEGGFIDSITARGSVTAKATEGEIKANFDKRVIGMSELSTSENPVITPDIILAAVILPDGKTNEVKEPLDLTNDIIALRTAKDESVKEIEALKTQNISAVAEIQGLKGQIEAKDAELKKLHEMHEASKTALGLNASVVVPIVSSIGAELSILEKYEAMPKGQERVKFFQANQKALFESFQQAAK